MPIAEIDNLTDLQDKVKPSDRVIKLKPYQDSFIFSPKRFPAMVSAWGTGKTMCGIERIRIDCERYPGNYCLIVRKEFVNLRDSTMRDWEQNTGITVDSNRIAKFPNGSMVLFRHADELMQADNLSSLNLGGVLIEQAEEFESDDVFWKLEGRIRRAGYPHWVGVIANTKGNNWIYNLWKAKRDTDFDLYEATSFDNAENLPADTIDSWGKMKERKPKIYNRFVMNSWDEEDVQDQCISLDSINRAIAREPRYFVYRKRIIGVDVSRSGNDKTVCYALVNDRIVGHEEWEKKDTMESVGRLLMFAEQNGKIKNFAIDELNAGSGVVDRLAEIGKNVIPVNSARGSNNKNKFRNIRAEVWGYGSEQLENDSVSLKGADIDLIEQLKWSRWKAIDSTMVLQVEPKEDIISRYGRSPDNADAYLYGLWGLQFIKNEVMGNLEQVEVRGWVHPRFRQTVPAGIYA